MADRGIKIVGLNRLQKKLKRVAKATPKEASKAINSSLMVAHGKVKDNLTNKILNVDTGTLRRSFLIKNSQPNKLYGVLGAKLVYAAIHEFGGIIRAKRVKYLRFKTKDGRWHSVKQVRIKARKYFSKSIKQSMKKIDAVFDKALSRIVQA
jgi:phage gpG-like protein